MSVALLFSLRRHGLRQKSHSKVLTIGQEYGGEATMTGKVDVKARAPRPMIMPKFPSQRQRFLIWGSEQTVGGANPEYRGDDKVCE